MSDFQGRTGHSQQAARVRNSGALLGPVGSLLVLMKINSGDPRWESQVLLNQSLLASGAEFFGRASRNPAH